jgi:monovalent cation/proton antiporter MnhG/PhaG subunit
MKAIAVDVLLVLGCLQVLLSCVGIAVARGPFNKLHFSSPPSTLGMALIAAAAMLQEGLNPNLFKVVLLGALMIASNPLAQHLTGRAARIRRDGAWRIAPEEEVAS